MKSITRRQSREQIVYRVEFLLDMALSKPSTRGPSTRDMSLLNLLMIVPVSVLVKKDCGALKNSLDYNASILDFSSTDRVTTSRSTLCNLRPVDDAIHTQAVLFRSAFK